MVKAVERFVVVAPIPGRPMAFGGTVLETLSDGRAVESALTEIPIEELGEWVESLNVVAIADNLRLQKELADKTAEWETLKAEKTELTTQRDSLQSRVTELTASRDSVQNQLTEATTSLATATGQVGTLTSERDSALEQVATLQAELDAIKNPPNPFPDADWKSFRFAILADPAINRVANENATAWPLMVLYLSQLDTMPSRGLDIAQLWNFLEANTAVNAEEIARINGISEQFGIPLRLNEQGQIAV